MQLQQSEVVFAFFVFFFFRDVILTWGQAKKIKYL